MGKTALVGPRETRGRPEPRGCGDLEENLAPPEKMVVLVLKVTLELPGHMAYMETPVQREKKVTREWPVLKVTQEHMAYTETMVQREKKATREDLEHKVFREDAEKMAHRGYKVYLEKTAKMELKATLVSRETLD